MDDGQNRRVLILAALTVIAVAICISLSFNLFGPKATPNKNRLAFGAKAKVDRETIAFNQSVELSGFSLDQIKDVRMQAISQHPELLGADYAPFSVVFDKITSGKPWTSITGYYFSGPSFDSVKGPSAESRTLLNPFLLVAPEFTGLSIWSDSGLKWDHSAVSAKDLQNKNFPLYPKPESLVWEPKFNRAEVRYNITGFVSSVQPYISRALTTKDTTFAVSAYNARDLGLFYIYLDPVASQNIKARPDLEGARARPISDILMNIGDNCGCNDSCNGRSPSTEHYDLFRAKELPATAVFKLWAFKPLTPDAPNAFEFKIVLD